MAKNVKNHFNRIGYIFSDENMARMVKNIAHNYNNDRIEWHMDQFYFGSFLIAAQRDEHKAKRIEIRNATDKDTNKPHVR